jgi:hypothetical protein
LNRTTLSPKFRRSLTYYSLPAPQFSW